MSVFEDYETAAVGYDNGRVADGVEGMVMMLSGLLKKPPKEVLCQKNHAKVFFRFYWLKGILMQIWKSLYMFVFI